MDFIPKVKNMDEPVNKETGEEKPNFIYEDDEDDEDEVEAKSESFIPQAKAKTIQNDIFEEDEPPPKPKKERKLTKNGKERKPMSEEHKLKLQQAREKAFLVKKQKAEERKKLKEQDAEEKNLLKLKKQKDIEKLKKEVYEEPPTGPQAPPPAPHQAPVREIIREPSITKEDLEKAQLNAIMSYEKLRLARKEEKKKKQSEDAEMDRLRDRLMKAKNPNNRFSMTGGFF